MMRTQLTWIHKSSLGLIACLFIVALILGVVWKASPNNTLESEPGLDVEPFSSPAPLDLKTQEISLNVFQKSQSWVRGHAVAVVVCSVLVCLLVAGVTVALVLTQKPTVLDTSIIDDPHDSSTSVDPETPIIEDKKASVSVTFILSIVVTALLLIAIIMACIIQLFRGKEQSIQYFDDEITDPSDIDSLGSNSQGPNNGIKSNQPKKPSFKDFNGIDLGENPYSDDSD